jgi:hypothetical protein
MTLLDIAQWIGSILSIVGAFLVMFNRPRPRFYGISCYFFANIFMMTWGVETHNWGILTMNCVFFAISIYSVVTHWKDR